MSVEGQLFSFLLIQHEEPERVDVLADDTLTASPEQNAQVHCSSPDILSQQTTPKSQHTWCSKHMSTHPLTHGSRRGGWSHLPPAKWWLPHWHQGPKCWPVHPKQRDPAKGFHTHSKRSAEVSWGKLCIQANTCPSVLLPSCTSGSSFHLRTGCLAGSHLPAPGGLLASGTPLHLLSSCHHLRISHTRDEHTQELDSIATSGSSSWMAKWTGRHFPLREHCKPQAIIVFNQTGTSSKIFWKIKLKSGWLIN